jgi:hypothetical protein
MAQAKSDNTAKFVEAATPLEVPKSVEVAVENPFVPQPIPTPVVATTNPLNETEKLWQDTKSLILFARRIGIDFEVLLRSALQQIEKGL